MATLPLAPRLPTAPLQPTRARLRLILLSYLIVTLTALIPRVLDLGGFVTIDEINAWIPRSERFLSALATGDFGATAQSAHPGITTVWLGAAGILLHGALAGWGLIDPADFAARLALMQLPIALVNAAAVPAGYWLLRRLFPPRLALLAALLWACDPFVVGFSRIIHIDGLMGSFSTLSLLAACTVWQPDVRVARRAYWPLIASGVCAGLAMLSKSPAVVLAPTIAGIAAWSAWRASLRFGWLARLRAAHVIRARPPGLAGAGSGGGALAPGGAARPPGAPARTHGASWKLRILHHELGALLIWGVAAALVAILLWPALWADPARAITQLTAGVTEEGGEPHQSGNFFLGQPVEAPGPSYYAVALVLRLTPWGLLGLGLLALSWRRIAPRQRTTLAAIAWFVLLLTLELTLFPKKFDRYLVPAFPSLAVLAAAGWWAALDGDLLRRRAATAGGQQPAGSAPAVAGSRQRARGHSAATRFRIFYPWGETISPFRFLLVALAVGNLAWWHPYSLIAYNQLLGGAPRAAGVVRMGWGEGMRQVADWLNAQIDSAEVATASTTVATLRPYLRAGVGAELPPRSGDLTAQTGYAVVYLRSLQDGNLSPALAQLAAAERPVHTVVLKGVAYAQIYQVAPAPAQRRTASFGGDIGLRGYDLHSSDSGALALTFFWRTDAAPPSVSLFAHLIGEDGRRYSQIDLPAATAGWADNRYYHTNLSMPLPDGVPPGSYNLLIGFYEPESFQRLPVGGAPAADPAIDGPDALLLGTFSLPMR